jgi:hypothetical protein
MPETQEHAHPLAREGKFLLFQRVERIPLAAVAFEGGLESGEDGCSPAALLGGQQGQLDLDVRDNLSHALRSLPGGRCGRQAAEC